MIRLYFLSMRECKPLRVKLAAAFIYFFLTYKQPDTHRDTHGHTSIHYKMQALFEQRKNMISL